MYKVNDQMELMYCIKCGKTYPIKDYYFGCPECRKRGESASVSFRYKEKSFRPSPKKGMQRYGNHLPYVAFPTLGEGNTPVISLANLAKHLGFKEVIVKNEFQNPTGSHKDRASSLIVARALEAGKTTIVAASSGNAGISLAAYAARAGLKCKIISFPTINKAYKLAIEATGAELITLERDCSTGDNRWDYMRQMVETYDWYPGTNYTSPPVGSSCFGVQGYKTIAYEIFEDLGDDLPEYILVPVSRGDLLWGIYEGFKELLEFNCISACPKLVCVEPFMRLSKVLEGEDYRNDFQGDSSLTSSIGGTTVTYQALKAVSESWGFACVAPQSKVSEDIRQMAHFGLYLEASSATIFSALLEAAENRKIEKNSKVLLIATSSGFKNNE